MSDRKHNYNKVIIILHSFRIHDFVYEDESDEEAIERARRYYDAYYKRAFYNQKHPKVYPDTAFWESTGNEYKAILDEGFQIMSYEGFLAFQRQHLIKGEPTEIMKEKYEDAFASFPPILWETIQGIEMFCSMEAYVGTYRWQYAHDHVTGKYYTKLVDGTDKTTWINEFLRK